MAKKKRKHKKRASSSKARTKKTVRRVVKRARRPVRKNPVRKKVKVKKVKRGARKKPAARGATPPAPRRARARRRAPAPRGFSASIQVKRGGSWLPIGTQLFPSRPALKSRLVAIARATGHAVRALAGAKKKG